MKRFKLDIYTFYDSLALLLAVPLSYYLRTATTEYFTKPYTLLSISLLYMVVVRAFMAYFKTTSKIWRYISVQDGITLGNAVFLGTTLWYLILHFGQPDLFLPRSLYFILLMLTLLLLGGGRVAFRFLVETFKPNKISNLNLIHTYLVGDLESIDKTIVAFQKPMYAHYLPVGIIVNENKHIGKRVRNIPILGSIKNLEAAFNSPMHKKAEVAIFVEGSSDRIYDSSLFRKFTESGIATLFLPTVGKFSLKNIPTKISFPSDKLDYDLLLRRTHYVMDTQKKIGLLRNKKLLVTGGGGSIGSEIVRQIALCDPEEVIIVDNSEYLLYLIDKEISRKCAHVKRVSILADVRDAVHINQIISTYKPHIVFHAAAIKHVPIAEENPAYAFQVNVLGTRNVIEAVKQNSIELMVMISTDKVVNPTSVMGATKQIAEMLCLSMRPSISQKTQLLTVRFGNVIGSNGSVLPLFEEQINEGGPLTITHKDMVRFFMTISEAVDLVLEAACMSLKGEIKAENGIYVLNMGEPVKIMDLAKQLLIIKGKTLGKDIDIVYTGLRPGEKLYEELFDESETVLETSHKWLKIAASTQKRSFQLLYESIQKIEFAILKNDSGTVLNTIKELALNFHESIDGNV
jgi:FlaA1/EpsC-like NDP-sugar epimerase